jgi:hypothetical protein
MPRWSHSKKEVRKALDDAVAAGFEVKDTSASGHSWGSVCCQHDGCGQRQSVWSTPADQDVHARQIRRFMARHRHDEDDEKA